MDMTRSIFRITLGSVILLLGCQQAGPFKGEPSLPQIIGFGTVSTSDSHESISDIAENGRTIYFTRSDLNFQSAQLYQSEYIRGQWRNPELLPFGNSGYDAGLKHLESESLAFFTSKRNPNQPSLSTSWNIWKVQKINNSWGQPQVLPAPINSDSLECCLTVNPTGTMFFASNREGDWNIYTTVYAQGQFTTVQKVSNRINSAASEWPSYISQDGNLLLFSSIRKSGKGGDDIFYAKKRGSTWSQAVLFDSIVNTSSYEDSPVLTPDHKYLLFSSWKAVKTSGQVSNIYYIKNQQHLTR